MKLAATIATLFAVGSCLAAGSATAATCNAQLGPISSTALVQGNNCGNNANFVGATFCSGISFSGTGTDAWAITLGANQNFTFQAVSPGTVAVGAKAFTPDIALLGTCADTGSCINEFTDDTGTATSGTISGNAAGTYFIIITDSSGTGNQCGTYDLSFNGTLPVKLENFSVD